MEMGSGVWKRVGTGNTLINNVNVAHATDTLVDVQLAEAAHHPRVDTARCTAGLAPHGGKLGHINLHLVEQLQLVAAFADALAVHVREGFRFFGLIGVLRW